VCLPQLEEGDGEFDLDLDWPDERDVTFLATNPKHTPAAPNKTHRAPPPPPSYADHAPCAQLSEEEEAEALLHAQQVSATVRLLALDCDLTLLGIHTGGGYTQYSAVELAGHIRPVFRIFLREGLEAGTAVAVVTFSPQPQLIKEAIEIGMQDEVCFDSLLTDGGLQQPCKAC